VRVLLIVPKSLLGQWQDELLNLFEIQAREDQSSFIAPGVYLTEVLQRLVEDSGGVENQLLELAAARGRREEAVASATRTARHSRTARRGRRQ
jgi:hypothetical protein